jgi:5-methylcytosine-specific restriction endonuclease McrA
MILTLEIFEKGKSTKGALNKKQQVLLGIPKLYPGWKSDIIGKDYSTEIIDQFLLLKDDHLIKRISPIKQAPEPKEPLDPNNVILTKELFFKGRSRNGGWGYGQVEALGEAVPLIKGWKKRLIGKEFTPEAIQRFLFLTNKHLDLGIPDIHPYDDSLKVVSQDLPLAEQYAHPKWISLRKRILFRDSYRCKACESKSRPLHIHHTIYQKGKFIWEIDEEFLMTLCQTCHENMHGRVFENFEHPEDAI